MIFHCFLMIWSAQAAHFLCALKGYDWSRALLSENMRAMKVQAWTSMDKPLPEEAGRRAALVLGAGALLALLAGCSTRPSPRPTQAAQIGSSAGGVKAVTPLNLSDELREGMLARTMLVVNTPYTYGGNSPEGGFDCSGLIQWAVGGITERRLPRTTAQWAQSSNPVSDRDLLRGDFVFFNTLGGRYSHMGIFVGNGQFVHAPSSGGTVQRVRMDNVYFAKRFTEARSIFA
jgi:cell wall-associated NlpC family hydrolase